MTHRLRRLLLAVLLVVLFLAVRPEGTRRELTVVHLFAVDLLSEPVTASSASAGIPFSRDGFFGYFSEDGLVTYRSRLSYRAVGSERHFVNHPRVPDGLVVQDASGRFVASLPVSGYPVFIEGRLFVVGPHSRWLAEFEPTGAELWRVDLLGPLTALAASDSLVAVAAAGAAPLLVGQSGSIVDATDLGLGVEAVHGLAVSPGAALAAIVSGSPATMTLAEVSSGRAVPILRRDVEIPPMARSAVSFDSSGAILLYAGNGEVRLLDARLLIEQTVPVVHPVVAFAHLPSESLHVVLTRGSEPDPSRGFSLPGELVVSGAQGFSPVRVDLAVAVDEIHSRDSRLLLRIGDRMLGLGMVQQ